MILYILYKSFPNSDFHPSIPSAVHALHSSGGGFLDDYRAFTETVAGPIYAQ